LLSVTTGHVAILRVDLEVVALPVVRVAPGNGGYGAAIKTQLGRNS
jgi:hypothetical protein